MKMTNDITPSDVAGMLADVEAAGEYEREPDCHVIPYAYNWLTDPGTPAATDSTAQADRIASMFAISVVGIAAERDSLRSELAKAMGERDRYRDRPWERLREMGFAVEELPARDIERETAEAIAAWLLRGDTDHGHRVDLTDPSCPVGTALTEAATALRNGTWRTP